MRYVVYSDTNLYILYRVVYYYEGGLNYETEDLDKDKTLIEKRYSVMKTLVLCTLKDTKEYIRNQHQIELIVVLAVFYAAIYLFDSISGFEAILSFIIACVIFLGIPFFIFLIINTARYIRRRKKK